MSQVFPYNNVTRSLKLTPFTSNKIRVLFPVNRVHLKSTPLSKPLPNLWDTMRGFRKILNILVNLIYLCFHIPSPQIFIPPKP